MTAYEKQKRHFQSNSFQVSLSTLNNFFVKHIGFSITKEQALEVCEELAQGKFTRVEECRLFQTYFKKTKKQNPRHDATKALKLILLYVKGENKDLASNAYLTHRFLPKYKEFLNLTQEQKTIHHTMIHPKEEDENVISQLYQEYDTFCQNIENKRYRITRDQLRYYKSFEKVFTEEKGLQKFYQLSKNTKILSKNYKNELYEVIISFIQRRREEFLQKDFSHLSLMKDYKEWVNKYQYSKDATLNTYYESVLETGETLYFLESVKAYLQNPVPFSQFCAVIHRKENEVIQLLSHLNQTELLKQITLTIQQEKQENTMKKEREYTTFIRFMKEELEPSITPHDFTLTHYYSLTSIPLDQMITKLIETKELELATFLKQVYVLNQDRMGKVKTKKYKELTNDEIQLIRTQMNQEHFPNITGVFEEGYRYYQYNLLENFTKEHYLQDLSKEKVYKKS